MAAPNTPLLSVKCAVPPPPQRTVPRQRLSDRLTESTDTPLCVVVAPAGWGKTSMLAEWAASPGMVGRAAWVSLDRWDDEPARFWSYVLAALAAVSPDVAARASATLSAPGVEPVLVTLPVLLEDMAAAAGQHVLILDDAHVLHDRQLLEGLEFLLTYLPHGWHVVLAGRADPALPLARWRGRGRLTEIRIRDLAFTQDESDALLAGAGVDLDASARELLWQRTEGWAVGLHLAARAVRESPHPEAAAARLEGDDRHLLDYFETEVLDRLEPAHRALLVQTSVLVRLSGPLCDAVLGRSDSTRLLAELEGGSHFVTALDRGRRWYRCHALFRDVLRRDLELVSPDASADLLSRAATWYSSTGQTDEAVRHLLAAGDPVAAMGLLRSEQAWFFERGAAADYLALGEEAARTTDAADPEVLLMMAYAAVLGGRFERARHWCDVAEPLLRAGTVSIDGWSSSVACLLTMRAAYADTDGAAGADVADGRAAVDLETDPTLPGYVLARTALASAHMRDEEYEKAVALLADAWGRPSRAALPTPVSLQTAGLYALNLLQVGDVRGAGGVCDDVRPVAATVEAQWGDASAASVTWLRLVEGRIARRGGDLTGARSALTRAADLAEVWGRRHELIMALAILSSTELAAGDRPAARDAATRAREAAGAGPVRAAAARELEAVETRLGRGAARAARRAGHLHEDLTDRELSVLRELAGPGTQREIGAALFLSVNTVKGYTKMLYRKLGASTRQEAVERGRFLGVI